MCEFLMGARRPVEAGDHWSHRCRRNDDLPITRRMLGVDLDGSRRIWPAHVGCLVDLDESRRVLSDRLDDQAAIPTAPTTRLQPLPVATVDHVLEGAPVGP